MMMGWRSRGQGGLWRSTAETSAVWGGGKGGGQGGGQPWAGIVAGTRIATGAGWRLVETISAGESVLTLDHGLQVVRKAERVQFPAGSLTDTQAVWPLRVPAEALGNQEAMLLLPGQNILVEFDTGAGVDDDPFAIIAARALDGYRGISAIVPDGKTEAVNLTFAQDQIVYASSAALLFCPCEEPIGESAFDDLKIVANRADYAPLSETQARHLVACMIAEDLGGALRRAARAPYQAALA